MTHQKDDMDTEALALTKAQIRRLYDNSPEHHGDATSFAGFARIVRLVEAALASKPDAAPAGGAVEALRWYADEARALAKHMEGGAHTQAVLASVTVLALDAGRRAEAALAAAPVVPPSILGASPCGGPGSAASRPEPQSVSALRAPIPGAAAMDEADLAFVKERKERNAYWESSLRALLEGTDVEYLLTACISMLATKDAVIRHQDARIQHERDVRGKVQADAADLSAEYDALIRHMDAGGDFFAFQARMAREFEAEERVLRARDQVRSTKTAGLGPEGAEPGPAGSRPEDRADGADQSNSGDTTPHQPAKDQT